MRPSVYAYPGHFFNHMLDLLRAAGKLTKISLNMDFKRDLNWFINFLPQFNGKAFISHRPITKEIELVHLYKAWVLDGVTKYISSPFL